MVAGSRVVGGNQRAGLLETRVVSSTQIRARSGLNRFERIRPGEGAPFSGDPNTDRVFGAKRPCPLPVAKLHSPHGKVTFTVFTDDGSELKATKKLFCEPRARVPGGLPCGLPILPFC